MSQDALAEQSGLNRSTVIRWESGDASRPEPDQVRAVCKILGIDPRQAAVALGYLTPEDLGPPDTQGRQLDPSIVKVIEILEDPTVPAADKQPWIDYLLYLQAKARNERQAAG
jgi:transcriptional regulator with XRE-family HTH domain